MHPSFYSAISFPALGIEVDPARSISLGSLSLYYYGIVIAAGLLLAVLYACRRCEQFGLKEDDLLDGVLCVTPFAVICARAYYVIFSWENYAANPISALYIWEGGLAIYGGVIGAVVGISVLAKIKKIPVPVLLDVVLLGFLIGQSIGRWGNFFNREAFGAPTEAFTRMGLLNTLTGSWEYYHPTFLYESVWNAVGFVLLHFLSRRRQYDGQIALGYAAWYGLGRTIIEGLRMDSLYWGNFRVSQLLSAILCMGAVVILVLQTFRTHTPESLWVNRVAAKAAAETEAPAELHEEAAAEEPAAAEEAAEQDPSESAGS